MIPNSKVYLKPALVNLEEASVADLIRTAMATLNYEWAWLEAGYEPWHLEKPHLKQQAFHSLLAKFRGFIGGVGSGKSMGGAAEAIRQIITQPGSVGIVGAPTFPALDQTTKPMFFQLLPAELIHKYNESKNYLICTNTSKVIFRGLEEPDKGVRGINATWFWVDEAGYITSEAWNILIGRLRQIGYRHLGWATMTPKGMNWAWERFAAPDHPLEYAYVTCSSRDNPWLTPDYVKSLEMSYSERWRKQEIEGLFVSFEGLYYPEFNPAVHVTDLQKRIREKTLVPVRWYYLIDWGYTNPTVILACAVDSDLRMFIVDEWYKRGQTLPDVIKARKELQEKWGKGMGIADPAQPGNIEQMNREHLPTKGANNEFMEGIMRTANRFVVQGDGLPRIMVDERCKNWIKECHTYRKLESKEGKEEKEKPLKVDDHAMDATRYGAMDLERARSFQRIKTMDEVI